MFINFLVNFLHLEQYEGPSNYVVWYSDAGAVLGAVIPALTSIVFAVLFYYVWSNFKATRTIHWILCGIVNFLTCFVLEIFIGRASLANFITETMGEEGNELWWNITTWPFTTDIWIFALNGIIWCLVLYFLFSLVIKHWSPVWNIPFGKKTKSANN